MPVSQSALSVPAMQAHDLTEADATAPAWLLTGAAFCAAVAVLLALTLF